MEYGVVTDYFDELELGFCLRVNALSRNRAVKRFFAAVSRLGDYPGWVLLGLVTLSRVEGSAIVFLAQTAATAISGVIIYKFLKNRLVRERPFITHGAIVCGTAPLDRYSFPSGHTLHAVSLTILYASYAPELMLLFVPFAILVAASRVILGLHYPTDVVVGGALGAVIATTNIALFS
jgi:undecaprenyl-diphosphatase